MRIILTLLVLLLSGCTHYLYQGDFSANDAFGKERQYRLYWTKTDKFLFGSSAGPLVLDITCDAPKTFEENEQGIFLRLPKDEFEGSEVADPTAYYCGEVKNLQKLDSYSSGPIQFSISCKPIVDEWARIKPVFIAQSDDYQVDIKVVKDWSLFGGALESKRLDCLANEAGQ
ncbi:hypothetical protein [Aliikangiella coralliicola]|uniref:Lipoprotein n=1 Tax=Aliikangiella coralliicola TaxID=2592383 RepID=A0A545UCU0_9GAMM|nr:hypothetical protein [Aliikangiella coralliicola]TQV87278.1 hypothetical protein FLL46_12565 [Aliikangiella coralliicola]